MNIFAPKEKTEEKRLPIGKEEVRRASELLRKYRAGKANLEKKIVENEEWYKLRHWECMRSHSDVEPTSG